MKDAFNVWKDDGSSRMFKAGPRGLYYCDIMENNGTVLAIGNINANQVNTVKSNIERYNQC